MSCNHKWRDIVETLLDDLAWAGLWLIRQGCLSLKVSGTQHFSLTAPDAAVCLYGTAALVRQHKQCIRSRTAVAGAAAALAFWCNRYNLLALLEAEVLLLLFWPSGILDKYGVELIGAKLPSIDRAEDRELFKQAMKRIGLKTPPR